MSRQEILKRNTWSKYFSIYYICVLTKLCKWVRGLQKRLSCYFFCKKKNCGCNLWITTSCETIASQKDNTLLYNVSVCNWRQSCLSVSVFGHQHLRQVQLATLWSTLWYYLPSVWLTYTNEFISSLMHYLIYKDYYFMFQPYMLHKGHTVPI